MAYLDHVQMSCGWTCRCQAVSDVNPRMVGFGHSIVLFETWTGFILRCGLLSHAKHSEIDGHDYQDISLKLRSGALLVF